MQQKVLIFIVTYNAETTITDILSRIPDELFHDQDIHVEILIIDDGSSDQTITKCQVFTQLHPAVPLTILVNPQKMRYGGNQKLGSSYAINHGFNIVCLLHGDGQDAPEELQKLFRPLLNEECEAVFGSRMMEFGSALKGEMPSTNTTLIQYSPGLKIP